MRHPLAFALALSFVVLGCKKEEKPVAPAPTAAPTPVPTPMPTMETPTEVKTLDEMDAGNEVDSGPKKTWNASPTAQLASRMKACCSAMRMAAKALGNSTEGGMLKNMATQCDGLAAQVKGGGTPTELAPLQQMMKQIPPGIPVPQICKF